MTVDELYTMFEHFQEKCEHFWDIPDKPAQRQELCLFLILDKIATHPHYVLGNRIDLARILCIEDDEQFATKITEHELRILVACGLTYRYVDGRRFWCWWIDD